MKQCFVIPECIYRESISFKLELSGGGVGRAGLTGLYNPLLDLLFSKYYVELLPVSPGLILVKALERLPELFPCKLADPGLFFPKPHFVCY